MFLFVCVHIDLQLDVEARLVELQFRLKAERVKLLGDDQRALKTHTHTLYFDDF